MFTKEERSKFPYWFAHWCAYNMTALVLKQWKFKYLFHDFEKPWLRLFLPYPKVQQWHRNHNKHHIEYWLKHNKADWDGMVIDWECSRYTKEAQPLDAFGQFDVEYKKLEKMVSPKRLQEFKLNIERSLIKLFTPEKKKFKIPKEIPYDKEEYQYDWSGDDRIKSTDVCVHDWFFGTHTEGGEDEPESVLEYYPVKIVSVDAYEAVTSDGENYGFEDLRPIILTQDILDTNLKGISDDSYENIMNNTKNFTTIKYVHQLQRLLSLFGEKERAENFEIPENSQLIFKND